MGRVIADLLDRQDQTELHGHGARPAGRKRAAQRTGSVARSNFPPDVAVTTTPRDPAGSATRKLAHALAARRSTRLVPCRSLAWTTTRAEWAIRNATRRCPLRC